MKKTIVFGIFLLLLLFFSPFLLSKVLSIECKPGFTYQDQKELETIKNLCEQKVNDLRNKANTLSSQIQYMDTQVYLTTLRIKSTEQKIADMQEEIELLSNRIEGLDNSLNYLSKILLQRIVQGYKTQSTSLFNLFFDSTTANDFINKVKYQRATQENNQNLLIQVQESKLNFEEQKNLREKKKVELSTLTETLNTQKNELVQQKDTKRKLLEVTRNDENTYTRIMEETIRQIASFRQFVQSTGVGVIAENSLGTGEGGWYYSQRDIRWANYRMGDTNDTVLDVGCFITSIAMVMKFYGQDFTPLNLATNSRFFSGGYNSACFPTSTPTAYMCIPSTFNGTWPNNLKYHNISFSEITTYLNKNVPVIVGVRGSSHYVVIKKIVDGEYIMNDPIYGPDIKVSDYYSISGPYGVFE